MIQTVNLPASNQKAYDSTISSIIAGYYPYSGKSRFERLYVIELSLSNCSNPKFSDLVVLSASFGLQITIVLLRDKGMLGHPRKISYVGSIRLAN